MIEKYGRPQVITANELRWSAVDPWQRIVVHRDRVSPLEQAVTYGVPKNKVADVRKFRHGVKVVPDEGIVSARSNSETANYLALNLAADIARGKRTPAQADRFFTRTIRLSEAGKSSPYTERLLH
jgi:hypothetical protein